VRWQDYRTIVIASASMLALLVAFRIVLPTPFHEDFRHIFPVLVPFCLLFGKSVERTGRWSLAFSWAAIGVGLLLIASSVVFFVRIP